MVRPPASCPLVRGRFMRTARVRLHSSERNRCRSPAIAGPGYCGVPAGWSCVTGTGRAVATTARPNLFAARGPVLLTAEETRKTSASEMPAVLADPVRAQRRRRHPTRTSRHDPAPPRGLDLRGAPASDVRRLAALLRAELPPAALDRRHRLAARRAARAPERLEVGAGERRDTVPARWGGTTLVSARPRCRGGSGQRGEPFVAFSAFRDVCRTACQAVRKGSPRVRRSASFLTDGLRREHARILARATDATDATAALRSGGEVADAVRGDEQMRDVLALSQGCQHRCAVIRKQGPL